MERLATRDERQKWWDSLTDDQKRAWYHENFMLKESCLHKARCLINLYRWAHFGSIRRVINGKRLSFIMPQEEMKEYGFENLRFKLENLEVVDKPILKDSKSTWRWSKVRLTISELKDGKIVKNYRYDMFFNLSTYRWHDKEDILMDYIEKYFFTAGGYYEHPVGFDD